MLFKYSLRTTSRNEFVDITPYVEESVLKAKVSSGIAVIHIPHTTAAVTINENADADVKSDIIKFLNAKIPVNFGFQHMEGNSDAHIKSSLFGPSLTVIIENGTLLLGTWQDIYFCEFDGPRTRQFFVKIISD